VVHVVPAGAVFLRPQLLDPDVGPPALDGACPLLDAGDGRVGFGERRFGGEADCGVDVFAAGGPD
jgi:hypothetical protein